MSSIDDKPTELIVTAILRAKMCEHLGAARGAARETYFTIGLFSALDALMDMPMGEALAALPLIQEIKDALLGQPCQERDALLCVINYERGNWDEVKFANLDPNDIRKAYLDAVNWTDQVIQQVSQ
jgi:EAL and modified HD-GYP domain-containing signal transduction protein